MAASLAIRGNTAVRVADATDEITDEELIASFQAGPGDEAPRELFDELFQRHHTRIIHWCFRFTGDREAAFDLTQEIFIKAYRSFHTFRGQSRFSTWIYVIARNHCLNTLKRRAHDYVSLVPAIAARLSDPTAGGIHQALENRQSVQRRWQFVNRVLTATETRVMMLHFGLDLSLDAITRELGLTNRSGAKAFIVSARRKLSSALEAASETESRPLRLRKEPSMATALLRRRQMYARPAMSVV